MLTLRILFIDFIVCARTPLNLFGSNWKPFSLNHLFSPLKSKIKASVLFITCEPKVS